MRRIILVAAALTLLVLAGLAGGSILERNRELAEQQALRAALDQARFAADSCKVALAWEEQEFLSFDRYVDSLRQEMESLEDRERGGVPQEDYQAYLEVFQRYNDSVAVWQDKADTLQASEAACRELIRIHNQLQDSIQSRQDAMRAENR